MLSAYFQWKLHSIMTGIVILSVSEGSRRHPRGCEILPLDIHVDVRFFLPTVVRMTRGSRIIRHW